MPNFLDNYMNAPRFPITGKPLGFSGNYPKGPRYSGVSFPRNINSLPLPYPCCKEERQRSKEIQ